MSDRLLHTFLQCGKVTTDSRNLDPGAIFFALRGERFNGNDFAAQAVEAGCPLVVVDEDVMSRHPRVLRVEDSLQALQQLALDYRRTFRIPVLAITGSNGKTTTKELTRDVLAKKFRVHATKGNLNNHIGIPLTILSMPRDTTFAVIEMGANHQGEIASYCRFTEPDYGVITNIGKAHLEGFGGIDGVKKGKKELYDFLRGADKVIFANREHPEIAEVTQGMSVVEFGLNSGGQRIAELKGDGRLRFRFTTDDGFSADADTQLAGSYNLWNIATAAAIGRYFGVSPEQIVDAIASYVPDNNRSQVVQTARNEVVMDAYNANPTSMEHALRDLASGHARRTYFIIGDMRELGPEGPAEHRRIAELAKALNLEGICVGELFHEAARDLFPVFRNTDEARQFLQSNPLSDRRILLKGSRGIRMESLSDLL
jgi:UDP-N-acetylmuramoyl-tripeptide--D-alanyl-D-alanine ligase